MPNSSTSKTRLGASAQWAFWIDRGGTFTDCVARAPDQTMTVHKVLSTTDATEEVIRQALGGTHDAAVPECGIRMGTTVATNALLQNVGAKSALVVTRGFADLCRIATGTRPALFSLHVPTTSLLADLICEVSTRVTPEGNILLEASDDEVELAAAKIVASKIESVAVSILGAYAAPHVENALTQRLQRAIANLGGAAIVVAATDVSREIGLLGRTDTALVDARITPLIRRHVATTQDAFPNAHLSLMQSSGALCPPKLFRGPGAILSGPAGGVVAARWVAQQSGAQSAIAFDMGGTSTDVSHVTPGCALAQNYEVTIANVRVRAPILDIHTVAAGGGSVCVVDESRFEVGPRSVGADPGPLCYGREHANELSITDVNLVVGRLVEDRFPFPLDVARTRAAVEKMAAQSARSVEEVSAGFLAVANAKMAQAISRITIGRGKDVQRCALIVLGGAGGQHACAIAQRLGMKRVLWHPFAGVLSAFGMGLAETSSYKSARLQEGSTVVDDVDLDSLAQRLRELAADAAATLARSQASDDTVTSECMLALRYRGTESDLVIEVDPTSPLRREDIREEFERMHLERYGNIRLDAAVEISTLRTRATLAAPAAPSFSSPIKRPAPPLRTTQFLTPPNENARMQPAKVFARQDLARDQRIDGPALIVDDTGTLVVDIGWTALVLPSGTIDVTRQDLADVATTAAGDRASGHRDERIRTMSPDPVRLTLFGNAFMAGAEQMGEVLRQCALSTNIRERLDFSCALFRHDGDLVANAPHIPVHLGAMSESVRAILQRHPPRTMREGDAFATNDPAEGGSHLPDITVVSPVFLPDASGDDVNRVPVFFVASRGHHADVGGTTPGSMPPTATTLDEEGVVLRAMRICRAGELDVEALRRVFCRGRFPARDFEMNLADLNAQLAANRAGIRYLHNLVREWGATTVDDYMGHTLDDAELRVRRAIARLNFLDDDAHARGRDGPNQEQVKRTFFDALDDGSRISVSLSKEGGKLVVDFDGSAPQHRGNLNAPRAVTLACVMYALRVLVDADVPLSSGFLRAVDVRIPAQSLLSPDPGRAVAAGNVETSQRIVDVVLAALGLCAASQGTMNNVVFGDDSFGYYETLGGGGGAGRDFDGPSAVQVHMTNTRLTDAEVVEARHPLRIWKLAVRRGSGGNGRTRGGDGIVREYEVLKDLDLSLITERRERRPFGLHGGDDGACGENLVDGEPVPGRAQLRLRKGQRLVVKTPGGGGFGDPPT